ncbi:RNA-directed DNA polymerase, eukaryota, reverse transcriptase zinc-binding domain protein [Tanacetum coccineum]
MNLGTSSQPQQQRLLDTPLNSPPHLPTQASQSESSPTGKGKSKAKGRKPRPNKIDVTHTCWTQEEEKLLTEMFIQISEDPQLGIDQSHKTFWGKVTSEYNHHTTVQRTKDMIRGKWTTLTRD